MGCLYGMVGFVAVIAIVYKLLSSVWRVIYPHVLAKRLGHVIDLKTLGKWAVVTGSTDGIGKSYAKELAKRGLNVFLISRNEERLKTTVEEIRAVAPNVEVKYLVVDFMTVNPADYQGKITDALKDIEIGILVNNVGMSYQYPEEFLKIRGGTEEYLQSLISVNCVSVMQMTKIVLPAMLAREKGAIVNIASSVAFTPSPYLSVYAASKVFVDYFTRGLRGEYSASGVIFQVVYPFYVATKMSGIKRKSFFIADPDEYATAALDTVGIVDMTCGNLSHELQGIGMNLLPSFALIILIKKALKGVREKLLRKEQKMQQAKKEE